MCPPALVAGRRPITNVFVEAITLTIVSLLPIMNPFATAPLFISLTASFDKEKRARQALMGCIYAFGILVVFLLAGAAIVDFFGISIPGIRVAGGLIISMSGFSMLFPKPPVAESAAMHAQQEDFAFTPIAMPSLAGPGSISVVLTAATQIKSMDDRYAIYVAVILGMALTLVFSFLVLRASSEMVKFLGPGGIDAMTRIFGFLLICIGMQFLLTGISAFYGIHPA
ncbi:MarC family NAAT transporter [bacterium]|nr:MAG: MarC family NAAT transporter [bacterium]